MTVLLAVDVGNTNTVLGVFRDNDLAAHWRIQTVAARTSDEYAILMKTLLDMEGFPWKSLDAGIISSVVPPAVFGLQRFFKTYIGGPAMVVGPGIKTGMPILYENPREVGADRIVNAVAAFDELKAGCIVVDFGTATTWDVVTPKGEYAGGVIAPGIHISSEALYEHAAKLPRVELARPGKVVARNTVASMQAGLVYGYAGMVDALVNRIGGPHFVDEIHLARLLRRDEVGQQHQPAHVRFPNEGKQERAAHDRGRADVQLRHAELRVVGDDAQVRQQRNLQARPRGIAVDA
jgi:type III pantothenate kinase